MLSGIKSKVVNSIIARKFYGLLFYYEQGKGQLNRFYSFLPDVIIILGGIKYLLGYDLSRNQVIFIVCLSILLFTLLGYFVKHTGLWDVDSRVRAGKDPVMGEIYEAAKRINGK